MGEITEGILSGDFCQYCGEYIGGGDGYPQTCAGCAADAEDLQAEEDEENDD